MGVSSTNIPEQFILYPNYPNPFNPITTIRYDLPDDAHVTLTIHDLMGREVITLVDGPTPAGSKFTQWNARDEQGKAVSAGVYLYKIQAGNFVDIKKMILLK
tara:strand:- start:1399 stop:1704 length:306 start_codon:yes stop_codon:yes gene_type:complete